MRVITDSWVMTAMIRSEPFRQKGQVAISRAKARPKSLALYPLTLGSGKRLLPDGVRTTFRLTSATPYPSGVVGLHYARQR
jgi:hypothetical protein